MNEGPYTLYRPKMAIVFTFALYYWRDALETVINSRKLSDALGNPSTQRKCFYCPIWQITLYFIRQEQLYALLKNKKRNIY